jgi:hypothetical protein
MFCNLYHRWVRQDSLAIGTADYGLDGRGSILGGERNFSVLHSVKTGPGAHPASYPMCIGVPFPGIKRPGREADNRSPPSSADVKIVELYLHSPLCLHSVVLN